MAMAALKRLPPSGRPTPQECKAVIEALAALHGRPNRHLHSAGLQPGCELKEPHTVLDSLVRGHCLCSSCWGCGVVCCGVVWCATLSSVQSGTIWSLILNHPSQCLGPAAAQAQTPSSSCDGVYQSQARCNHHPAPSVGDCARSLLH